MDRENTVLSTATESPVNITKCPICKDVYNDPRLLPCHHTCCLRCIEEQDHGSSLICPICGEEARAPENGWSSLEESAFIKKLQRLQELAHVDASAGRAMCEECLAQSDDVTVEIKLAELYCLDCKLNLCKTCAEEHAGKATGVNNQHRCVKPDSESIDNEISKLLDGNCATHNGQEYKMYCFDCRMPICESCHSEKHKTHRCQSISKIETQFRHRVKNGLDSLGEEAEKCRQQLGNLENIKLELTADITKVEADIVNEAERLKRLVDEEKDILLAKLVAAKSARIAKLEKAMKGLEQHITQVDVLRTYVDELRNKGTAIDLARDRNVLQSKIGEMLKFKALIAEVSGDRRDANYVAFIPSNMLVADDGKAVGEISTSADEGEYRKRRPAVSSIDRTAAGSDKLILDILDITKCHLCKNTYSDPRSLPCRHTFCLACIKEVIEQRHAGNTVSCPVCRRQTILRRRHAESLPINGFIRKLVLAKNFSNAVDGAVSCGVCGTSTTGTTPSGSQAYCLECQETMCRTCERQHDKTHQRFVLRPGMTARDIIRKVPEPDCGEHEGGESLRFYCHDCKTAICVKCLAEVHQTHKVIELDKINVVQLQKQLAADVEVYDSSMKRSTQLFERVAVMRRQMTDNTAKAREEVRRQEDEMKKAIETDAESLLQEIESNERPKTARMDAVLSELESHVLLLGIAKRYIDELKNQGTAADIARELAPWQRIREELVKYDGERATKDLEILNVSFEASEIVSDGNVVGTIIIHQPGKDALLSSPRKTQIAAHDVKKCRLCNKIFKDPRFLPCLHTFCLHCINTFHNSQPSDSQSRKSDVRCPTCSRAFRLPSGGISSLPENRFICRLIEGRNNDDTTNRAFASCDSCKHSAAESTLSVGQVKIATKYCINCKEKLCQQCSAKHRRHVPNRAHEIVQLADNVNRRQPANGRGYCEQHPDEPAERFCHDCNAQVCSVCAAETHQQHAVSDAQQLETECRQRLSAAVTQMSAEFARYRKLTKEFENAAAEWNDRTTRIEQEIVEEADRLFQSIDRDKQLLMQNVEQEMRGRMKKAEDVLRAVGHQTMLIEILTKYVEELHKQGSPGDVIRDASVVEQAVHDLLQFNVNNYSKKDLNPVDMKFIASRLFETHRDNVVGKLELKAPGENTTTKHMPVPAHIPVPAPNTAIRKEDQPEKRPSETTLPPTIRGASRQGISAPSLTRVINEKSTPVQGLALLGDIIAIVREPTEQRLEVYHSQTLSRKRDIYVPHLGDVTYGMTSCPVNRCFYVSDFMNNTIHRITPPYKDGDNYGPVMKKWKVAKGPTGLSVSRSHHDVIVVYKTVNLLQVFTPDGALRHTIKLQSDIVNPRQAIQVNARHFLVLHGQSRDPLHCLSLVGTDGAVIMLFGGSPGPRKLNSPQAMLMANNGCVLVGDHGNGRVIVCGPSLTGARDLLPSDVVMSGLRHPSALCLDESRGRLYVGELEGRMLVFDNVSDIGTGLA